MTFLHVAVTGSCGLDFSSGRGSPDYIKHSGKCNQSVILQKGWISVGCALAGLGRIEGLRWA